MRQVVLMAVVAASVVAIGPLWTAFAAENNDGKARNNEVLVTSPIFGSTVKGDTKVTVLAPGFTSVTAKCWKQGEGFGADSEVATVKLDADGKGSFVFPADAYPHGPVNVRIIGAGKNDTCNLMLYNSGGVKWNEGAPAKDPPGAEGLKVAYLDEFDKPLSISKDGKGTTYCSHKPGGGDFGNIPFSNHELGANSPFSQVDTYLRIRADSKKKTSGILCSMRMDGSGMLVKAPCYFECRFIAQSAKGIWPAFWTMTQDVHNGLNKPADELDIIEAYGENGHKPGYFICTHYWNQGDAEKTQPKIYKEVQVDSMGGKTGWWTTFHTYGIKVAEDTVYYVDNVEVGRHKSGKISLSDAHCFFINLAAGGGWGIDLSRYDGVVDMYTDFVRVYNKSGTPEVSDKK